MKLPKQFRAERMLNDSGRDGAGTSSVPKLLRLKLPSHEDFRVLLPSMHHSRIRQIVFSVDGSHFASIGEQSDINIWSTYRRAQVGSVVLPKGVIAKCIAFGPTDADWTIAVGTEDGEVLLLDDQWSVQSRFWFNLGCSVEQLVLLGDSSGILVVGRDRFACYSWNPQYFVERSLVWHNGDHICCVIPDDQSIVATGSSFGIGPVAVRCGSAQFSLGSVHVSMVPNERPRLCCESGSNAWFGSVRADVAPGENGFEGFEPCTTPFFFNWKAGFEAGGHGVNEPFQLTDPISHPWQIHNFGPRDWRRFDLGRFRSTFGLTISPDGAYVASASDDGILRVWRTNLKRGSVDLLLREEFGAPLVDAAFSPDGARIAVAEVTDAGLCIRVLGCTVLPSPIEFQFLRRSQVILDDQIADELQFQRPGKRRLLHDFDVKCPEIGSSASGSTKLAWGKNGESLFLWSPALADVYQLHLESGQVTPVCAGSTKNWGDSAITSFACSADSAYIAMGTQAGTVILRHQEEPLEQIPLVNVAPPGWVLLPANAKAAPRLVYSPQGTLTLTGVPDGRVVVQEHDPDSWRTTIVGERAIILTGSGKILVVDLLGETPTQVQDSPLGEYGSDPLSPLCGNCFEYMVAYSYWCELTPVGPDSPHQAVPSKRQVAAIARSPLMGTWVNSMMGWKTDQMIVCGGMTNSVFAVDLGTGATQKLFDFLSGACCRLEMSSNGHLLGWWIEDGAHHDNVVELDEQACENRFVTRYVVCDLDSLVVASRGRIPGLCSSLTISPDSRTLAGVWGSQLRIIDVESGTLRDTLHLKVDVRLPLLHEIWDKAHPQWNEVEPMPWFFPSIVFAPEGNEIWVWDESQNKIRIDLDTHRAGGSYVELPWVAHLRQPGTGNQSLVSASGRYAAFGGFGDSLQLYDLGRGNGRILSGHLGYAYPSSFLFDESIFVSSGTEGAVRFWETRSGKLRLELRVFGDREWIAACPDGRWDGTPGALDRVRLSSGTWQASAASSLSNLTPGLIKQLFDSRFERDRAGAQSTSKSGQRPTVIVKGVTETESDTISLEVAVHANDEKPDVMLVFSNGKLVVRNLDWLSGLGPRESRTVLVEVPLGSARTSIDVEVCCASGVRSERVRHTVARLSAPLGRLYGVCAGVNSDGLRFAESDSSKVAELLARQPESEYADVEVWSHVGHEASRANIMDSVARVAREAKPQDAFVFFFAGHGRAWTEQERQAHLLLFGASILESATGANLLGTDDLSRWMFDIKAQRQLWLFDACGTGTLSTTLELFSDSDDFKRLAFEVGCHIFAATQLGGAERAEELARGGAFTSCLMEALLNQQSAKDVTDIGRTMKALLPKVTFREPFVVSPAPDTESSFRLAAPLRI